MNNPPLSLCKSTWMVYGHLIVNIQRLVVELGIVGQLLHGPCGGFATTTRFGSGDLGVYVRIKENQGKNAVVF